MRPAFRLAYDDDLIRRNPFDFEFATVIVNDSVTREAITRDQERKYLEFVKQDKHFSRYYEGIFILFNTGLRISEFVGLTTKNIDFKHHKIIVDHQLIRSSKMQYMIEEPKTESGVREIPMSEEVEAAFRAILAKRVKPKVEPVIDGYSGFLYLDKTICLWWLSTGRSTFSTFSRSITASTRFRCRKLHPIYADIPFAPKWQRVA